MRVTSWYCRARVEPVTLAVLGALTLLGSGAGAMAVRRRRAFSRKVEMRAAVRAPIGLGTDPPVSLFDVFWDLGASDFALELLAARGLLLERPAELSRLQSALPEAVREDGGYAGFIATQLEAMEEFYRDHRTAGDRRAVFALVAPAMKALPAAGAQAPTAAALMVPTDAVRAAGVAPDLADRGAWRVGTHAGPLLAGGQAIDVDRVGDVDVGRLLGSIFDGSIAREAQRWFAMRDARELRARLDEALVDLYAVYASQVRPYPAALSHLYDAANRWAADASRIAALRQQPSLRTRPWSLCGEVLLAEAEGMARALGAQAAGNVDATLRHIDGLVQQRNAAMAGYLVYLNRYAFFVGRLELCQAQVGAIETALAKLQAEMVSLQRKGMV